MPKAKTPPSSSNDKEVRQTDHKFVGEHLRTARKAQGLTLAQLSARSGIAVSTISKAERGDVALTYDKFAALTQALSLDLGAIFRPASKATDVSREPSFTAAGSEVVYDTPNYVYGMLANDLVGKRMVPMRARIHARAPSDFPDYIRHGGEEFVFVLEGTLELRFENGKTYRLEPGDSLYFDSSVGHIYVSLSETDAQAVVCCVDTGSTRLPDTI